MREISACLFSALLLAGCGPQEGQEARDLQSGRQLYEIHCGRCHGAAGQGAFFKGIPPISYSTLSELDMVAHIRGHDRMEDSQMPTFSGMPQEELAAIARYVLHALSPE